MELFLLPSILCRAKLSLSVNGPTTDSPGGVPCVENDAAGLIHGEPRLRFRPSMPAGSTRIVLQTEKRFFRSPKKQSGMIFRFREFR